MLLVALGAALALGVSLAGAELTEHGDLFVKFSGGIAPGALPRHARAPISVRVAGTIRTFSGERPPALRRIRIAINRGGRFDTRGLPTCRRADIEPSSNAEALRSCRTALIGEGSFAAKTAFPDQEEFPTRGRILAFNAVVGGRRAILAHVFGTNPVPISRIIVFHIRETRGTYGTVLTGEVPATVNRYGYVTRISLSLHRRFEYRGRTHSYLTAACDAPSGFTAAVFPFARASMTFADGRTLASTLTRSCKVRG